ncbi:unnamed protein product [Rotaria sp. Silwood1]|nr:unnamed protein product [Rotaria sp. Silwood1]CAF1220629.1 unnamed protein product [Rotaria sp. Silwood1]CAF3482610.1 unnamed protein product [Rotaria sp. Silwood1]CAF3510279.1 unnamed protein product [Rotaria sp. Silwood1]CAF3515906.1 unnamed protein product [Rotaria sp. Silwood1]
MLTTPKENSENDEQRSFNVLGKPFHIRIHDLVRYPNTLLADHIRLQTYWRPSLNAYFFSRDVHIFERIILPFYTSSESSNKIIRPLMISLSEKLFQEELAFYNLLEYYQEERTQVREKSSSSELVVIIASFQSPVFVMQVIFASLPFIVTLLSYKHTGTWYFIMGLAFRHLLLIRLCLRDMCHLIDLLYYNGRSSFRVISHLLLFLATVIFMCIWIGIILYVTDSSSMTIHSIEHRTILAPSRYIYFVYQILLNVGYGDTTEQSILSFITIIIMTLIACPLLIIIYQKLIQELDIITIKMSHVETLHRISFINYLITHINRYHSSIVN